MPLASFCGCVGQFVSYLLENPKDRFSRDEAQIKIEKVSKNAIWDNKTDDLHPKMTIFVTVIPILMTFS